MSLIMILPSTPVDTQPMLKSWQLNPHWVPPTVCQEDDGTMHLLDVDIWMWVQAAPNTATPTFWWMIWKLFQQPGQWALVGNTCIPPPMGDTLRSSIKRPYEWGAYTLSTAPIGELVLWLATSTGITTERAQWLKHFAARVALGEAHNEPVWASKPKKGAGEQHQIKMFPKQLQMSRLDNELTDFTSCAQAEAAAVVNAAELPLTFPSEGRAQPAPYELDN